MSSFRSLIFTRPRALSSASRHILRSFFEPHREFLSTRGINLDELSDPANEGVFARLTQTFLSPGEDTPRDLVDAIFCVSELATPAAADALVRASQAAGLELPAEATTAEVAMLLYLADPAAARQLNYEHLPLRARAFEYFSAGAGTETLFAPPSEARIEAIERSLNIWFEKRRMGSGCRIFTYTRDHETWFLIRHGDSYRREAAVADDGSAASVLFRPEKFDVLVYDALTEEIRINAKTPALRDRYRTTFSLELFGRESFFPETNKYTLDPIRRDGADLTQCADVPGLVWVRLVKLEYELPELEKEVRSHRVEDFEVGISGVGDIASGQIHFVPVPIRLVHEKPMRSASPSLIDFSWARRSGVHRSLGLGASKLV